MSVDFDRSNFEFDEEPDNETEISDTEPVEPIEPEEPLEPVEGAEAEPAAEGRGLSSVRIIILVVILLLLLCVVCFLGRQVLPDEVVGQLPPIFGGPTATQPPTTSTSAPTDEFPLPTVDPTTETPTDEAPAPTVIVEPEPSEEPTDVMEPGPTEEPTVVVEPTDDGNGGEEPPPVTTPISPVPGPTVTPGPTVIVTVELCEGNDPPVADANGPYNAMRGKGQAVVEFDGSNSSDQDGEIIRYEWDFGDGSDPATGEQVTHGYTSTGQYVARLIVTDNCGDTDEDTAEVNIVGPTPPANGTPEAGTPEAGTPEAGEPKLPVGSADGIVGWCYRVQYGDTMTGIAYRFGASLRDLAFVNGVNMNYFVIAGQGLFVPTGAITAGPNVYEVQTGDTLNSVAYQCGLTTASLASANGLSPSEGLTPGQVIMIPPWIYR